MNLIIYNFIVVKIRKFINAEVNKKYMNIVHHTRFDFPLDKHFLGESIVMLNLTKNKHKNIIITEGENQVKNYSQIPTRGLAGLIASKNFGIDLRMLNFLGRKETTQEYMSLIKNLIDEKEGPIILNYHFPRKDLEITKKVKNEFGNDVKTILHFHCMPELFEPTAYNRSKDKRSLQELMDLSEVDKFIAVTNSVKTAFQYKFNLSNDKITSVRNGVDAQTYIIENPQRKLELKKQIGIEGDNIIGYVGRMNKNKGVNTSLQLVKKANDNPNNTYGFVFATSNGQERKHFLNKVQEIAPKLIEQNRLKIVLDISKLMGYSTEMNNITKQHFSRQLEQEGIVYSKAYGGIISSPIQSIVDIYMQPSESEGLPLSVVESLIVGTPVIASNVGEFLILLMDLMGY